VLCFCVGFFGPNAKGEVGVTNCNPPHNSVWEKSRDFLSLLAAVNDRDSCGGAALGGANLFNLVNNIHALGDASENNVLAIQPGGLLDM